MEEGRPNFAAERRAPARFDDAPRIRADWSSAPLPVAWTWSDAYPTCGTIMSSNLLHYVSNLHLGRRPKWGENSCHGFVNLPGPAAKQQLMVSYQQKPAFSRHAVPSMFGTIGAFVTRGARNMMRKSAQAQTSQGFSIKQDHGERVTGRWAALLVSCLCAWLGSVPSWGNQAAAPEEITTFHQFYALSPELAANGAPVRLKGTVVSYDTGWNQLYVHDGVEVAWLSAHDFQTNLQAGLNIEITGSTTSGPDGPALTNLHLQVLGHGTLPKAKRLELTELSNDLGQWVEVKGSVRVADTSQGRLALVLEDKSQSCLVYVMGLPTTNDFKWLPGSNVRLRGINASKVIGGRLDSTCIFVPGLDEVTVLEHGPKPSEMPVVSIDALLNRDLGSWTNNPVHLNGLIVSYKPGESLIVKDATGLIRARVVQFTGAQVDERVDVWGYLSVLPNETILRDACFEIQHSLPANTALALANQSIAKPSSNGPVITRLSDICKMSREEASQGLPVRLQGIVTYADPDWGNCFVQDRKNAIYVALSQKDVTEGQWVEVTGQVSPGGFAPEIINSSIRFLSTTNLPEPVKVDLEDLANGHLDSHWVQLEGVVRRVTDEWGHMTLSLTTPQGRFKATVLKPNDGSPPPNLIDALVSVQGACTSEMNTRGQLTGISLRVPGFKQVRILESVPADPFTVQSAAISSVSTFDPGRLAGRRVKVSGSVTLVLPEQGFYIQDASGGIRVSSAQTNQLQIGDVVDVLGFPAMGDFSPYLEEATFRRSGSGSVPNPQPATAEAILRDGTNDAVLVQIEASLVQRVPHSAHPKLVLQSGPILFTASLATQSAGQGIPSFQVGSLLRLTGVCSIQSGERHEPESFRLLVSDSRQVALLSTPPWWTIQHSLMLAGGLALGGLLAWAWSGSLRRQVRAQTEVIRRNHQELVTISRQAGMAEVATAVLHNVGNVLNSINVSAAVVTDALRKSKSGNVSRVATLMQEHAADLGHFMTEEKGRQLPDYLVKLGGKLQEENRFILNELTSLTNNIQHINDIVAMQQSYARIGGMTEKVKITDLVEDAFRMNVGALDRHQIQLVREYDPSHSPEIIVDKHKVLQILVNLVSNAKYACSESGQREKRLTLRVTSGDERVRISCVDNGVGIVRENLTRIFSHGFTTRKNGHGFGLHSAALAAKELGGALLAHSEGPGQGATFTLELPLSPKHS